jgi:hypothetical protein
MYPLFSVSWSIKDIIKYYRSWPTIRRALLQSRIIITIRRTLTICTYPLFLNLMEKVVWLKVSFESGKILKLFIIIITKGNNQIITFFCFLSRRRQHSVSPSSADRARARECCNKHKCLKINILLAGTNAIQKRAWPWARSSPCGSVASSWYLTGLLATYHDSHCHG